MDELTKQQLMVGVLFFNVTLIGYMLYRFLIVQNIIFVPVNFSQMLTHLGIGAAIAIVPGIVGYFVGRMMYK
jgi:hypothetical protein